VHPNGQVIPSSPATSTTAIDPIKTVFVESRNRTDFYATQYEITLRREWTGEVEFNVFQRSAGWEKEA
jgi:hypothetical protein